jgi:hypothetical protein
MNRVAIWRNVGSSVLSRLLWCSYSPAASSKSCSTWVTASQHGTNTRARGIARGKAVREKGEIVREVVGEVMRATARDTADSP